MAQRGTPIVAAIQRKRRTPHTRSDYGRPSVALSSSGPTTRVGTRMPIATRPGRLPAPHADTASGTRARPSPRHTPAMGADWEMVTIPSGVDPHWDAARAQIRTHAEAQPDLHK